MRYEGIVVKVTEKHIVLFSPKNVCFKNVSRREGEFPLIGER